MLEKAMNKSSLKKSILHFNFNSFFFLFQEIFLLFFLLVRLQTKVELHIRSESENSED